MSIITIRCAGLMGAATLSCAVHADLTFVGPFQGQFTDTFDQYDNNSSQQTLDVFGGVGQIANLTPTGAIKVEFASTFQGDQVVPISDMMMGQLGVAEWTFDTPAFRFGAWWENNSGEDDATLMFYDVDDNFIGEVTADVAADAQGWTWNGWESDTPFSRIVVTGNGVLNGFLWYENVQLDVIPAPAGLALLGLAGVVMRRSRRKRMA